MEISNAQGTAMRFNTLCFTPLCHIVVSFPRKSKMFVYGIIILLCTFFKFSPIKTWMKKAALKFFNTRSQVQSQEKKTQKWILASWPKSNNTCNFSWITKRNSFKHFTFCISSSLNYSELVWKRIGYCYSFFALWSATSSTHMN